MSKQKYVISLLDAAIQRGDAETGMLAVLTDLKQYAKYGIPPIYRNAINRMQLPLLELASELVTRNKEQLTGRTDVILCAHPGTEQQLQNHYRVTTNAMIREIMAVTSPSTQAQLAAFLPAHSGSSHDKVGEMATTMATRIAQSCQLQGRAFAINSGDNSFAQAISIANDGLKSGKSDAVLVLIANEVLTVSKVTPLAVGAVLLQRSDENHHQDKKAYLHATQTVSQQGWPASVDLAAQWYMTSPDNTSQCEPIASSGLIAQPVAEDEQVLGCVAPLAVLLKWLDSDLSSPTMVLSPGQPNEADIALVFGREPLVFSQADAPKVVINAQQVWFAGCQGVEAYWQGLNDDQGGMVNIVHEALASSQVHVAQGATFDSYYSNKAALLQPASRDKMGHVAVASVMQTVLESFPTVVLPTNAKGMVITAGNLAPYAQRRVALLPMFTTLTQQIEEVLQANQEVSAQQLLQQWLQQFAGDAHTKEQPTWMLSKQIANFFSKPDWQQLALEAACAGSIAAIDCAVNAITSGRVDFAFVAAAEMPVNLHDLCLCSSQQMLSHSVIATFTEQADGFTPGEGCALILLSRVDATVHLPKLAVIEAIGSSTYSKSMIAPNSDGQVNAMRHAFTQTSLLPSDIEFVETHGTGTPIGDLVETQALSTVYQASNERPLNLGALKTQFGHTFAAAGLASVCKVALCFEHQWQPHNLIRGVLRDQLQLPELNFNPLCQGKPFLSPRGQRHAAVNGFGTGGVNYHLIISDYCGSQV